MAKRIVFLQLAPEFGSTKFGPFAGAEIRLGSDPGRNDIVLPEGLGVAPEHARLVKQQDESFILAPVDRTSQVYVWRADGRPAKQITSPIAVVGGDGFSLVSAEGPRFIIVLELPKQVQADEKAKGGIGKAASKLGKKSLAEEIKRQGITRVLTTGAGQMVANAWTFIKSGSFLQPRYIIMGMMLLSGWVLAGGIGCTAAGFAWQGNKTSGQLEQCKGDLAMYQGTSEDGGEEDITLTSITAKILANDEWRKALDDPKLREAYIQRLKVIKKNAEDYQWLIDKSSNDFVKFKARLEADSSMPKPLVRVLAYAAATPGWNKDQTFKMVRDSNAQEACGRGPLLMTYRAAKHLKFTNLQLDGKLDATKAAQKNREDWIAALTATASTTNETPTLDDTTEIDGESGSLQGGDVCVHIVGDDDRTEVGTLVTALRKELGTKAKGLPSEGDKGWLAMRALRYVSADFEAYDQLDFSDGSATISVVLDSTSEPLSDDSKTYAVNQVADLLARATFLPCVAKQYKGAKTPPEELMADAPESKVTCYILSALIDEEG